MLRQQALGTAFGRATADGRGLPNTAVGLLNEAQVKECLETGSIEECHIAISEASHGGEMTIAPYARLRLEAIVREMIIEAVTGAQTATMAVDVVDRDLPMVGTGGIEAIAQEGGI